jgi:threonine synthase
LKHLNKKRIAYQSTNLKAPFVTFRDALLKGLAPDGGLYMPDSIPALTKHEIASFFSCDYSEMAFRILHKFLHSEIKEDILNEICRRAYNYDVPVEKIANRSYILRLDRGPTASFKDFAARVMARLMNHYATEENLNFTVLTATSGDTGSAVASAFHGLRNIKVIILFPASEVSDIQRKQMTTLGANVKVIAIDGKFDDCQLLVKKAFTDIDLSGLKLTSANSINIGRLLPQSVYYFYSWSRVASGPGEEVIFSVPSGNYGNLMGGILAREMGLPVSRFVIASNSNNEVPEYLRTGIYRIISPSLNCISSAMNVGHPSNLARIIALYGGIMNEKGEILSQPEFDRMKNDFFGISISDDATRETMAAFFKRYNKVIEPHGAVAWKGLEIFQEDINDNRKLAISLETAHPAKFPAEFAQIPGINIKMPVSLSGLEEKKEDFIKIENNYSGLKKYLLSL